MPMLYRRRLGRRTFLRAAGVSLGLPLLDAMLPAGWGAETTRPAPRRLVVLQRPLGTYAPYFFPAEVGPDFQAPPLLKLIETHRRQFTVFSGVSHPGYPNTHTSEFGLLTAAPPEAIRRSDDVHNTVSLDQVAAAAVGKLTRFPYVLLGPMGAGLSFTALGVPLPGESSRAATFARLFLDGPPAEVARAVRRLDEGQSILDAVNDQLRSLDREVGADDRRRLDRLAESVREAERGLAQEKTWATRAKPQVGEAGPDADEWVGQTRQWYDLIHLACQTDSTRVIVHRVPEQLPTAAAPGTRLGEHDASHHGQDPKKIEQVAAYESAHFRLLDHLLGKLAGSAEVGGSLLDHTQVLFLSNLGDGSAHSSSNLPVLLAGGGYRHRGHVRFDGEKNYPLANIYVRVLRQMGLPCDKFGTSTGALGELD